MVEKTADKSATTKAAAAKIVTGKGVAVCADGRQAGETAAVCAGADGRQAGKGAAGKAAAACADGRQAGESAAVCACADGRAEPC